MLLFLVDVGENVVASKVRSALVQLASIIQVFPLRIFIFGNDLEQFIFLLLFQLFGIFIFLFKLLNISQSFFGLSLHSALFLTELFIVLLIKLLGILMRTTFKVSHFLQRLIMVDIILVTGVDSNFIELINFLFLDRFNLCSLDFDLSPLLVLDYLVLHEFILLGFSFTSLVLHQVVLHDFVPGFLRDIQGGCWILIHYSATSENVLGSGAWLHDRKASLLEPVRVRANLVRLTHDSASRAIRSSAS